MGKTRNAQRVLKDLSNYVSSFTDDKKNVYYLNSNGRERVQAEKVRKKTAMVTHYLMRNDLYITVGCPVSWRNEVEISINNVSLIADAAYISDKLHHFIEVDNKQSMSNNIQKIKKYKKLSTYNPKFVLIWVTTTPYRKKKLESLSQGLKFKIYLWEDLK
ncbi:replication-relaxation family protein [Heyndrickxia oleronia]|uniref:replication-relaxation family protein n=1 Tax=Heyndrickxia oleronia TaxID=38875 RepID=UPI003F527C00